MAETGKFLFFLCFSEMGFFLLIIILPLVIVHFHFFFIGRNGIFSSWVTRSVAWPFVFCSFFGLFDEFFFWAFGCRFFFVLKKFF
jgi:hypothetical protein